jgi:hypothetical protein
MIMISLPNTKLVASSVTLEDVHSVKLVDEVLREVFPEGRFAHWSDLKLAVRCASEPSLWVVWPSDNPEDWVLLQEHAVKLQEDRPDAVIL